MKSFHFLLLLLCCSPLVLLSQSNSASIDATMFEGMTYRMAGPFRGGRVTTVEGIADKPHTFYMGTTGGGVWKTEDAGNSWQNISDEFFEVGSIGSVEVADADPNVIM